MRINSTDSDGFDHLALFACLWSESVSHAELIYIPLFILCSNSHLSSQSGKQQSFQVIDYCPLHLLPLTILLISNTDVSLILPLTFNHFWRDKEILKSFFSLPSLGFHKRVSRWRHHQYHSDSWGKGTSPTDILALLCALLFTHFTESTDRAPSWLI